MLPRRQGPTPRSLSLAPSPTFLQARLPCVRFRRGRPRREGRRRRAERVARGRRIGVRCGRACGTDASHVPEISVKAWRERRRAPLKIFWHCPASRAPFPRCVRRHRRLRRATAKGSGRAPPRAPALPRWCAAVGPALPAPVSPRVVPGRCARSLRREARASTAMPPHARAVLGDEGGELEPSVEALQRSIAVAGPSVSETQLPRRLERGRLAAARSAAIGAAAGGRR